MKWIPRERGKTEQEREKGATQRKEMRSLSTRGDASRTDKRSARKKGRIDWERRTRSEERKGRGGTRQGRCEGRRRQSKRKTRHFLNFISCSTPMTSGGAAIHITQFHIFCLNYVFITLFVEYGIAYLLGANL